ncbi:hypothetical protein JW766_01035 [Candidatus Dojkabacteria bacterium]|nr:hypothetical protein [Candidatus Dojkabacteria bacterium]
MDKINNFLENLRQNELSNIDWSLLFDWEYLTDPNPTKVFIYEQWIYVIVLVNLFLSTLTFITIARKFYEVKPRFRFIRKVSFLWFTNTIFLLFYNLVRSEGVKFLSMRLFLMAIICGYIVVLLYAVGYWVLRLPKQLEKFEEARLRSKYSKRSSK